MKYILAHDIGTSGNKATLYNQNGDLIKSHIESYTTHFFNDQWAEQNPTHWWKAVCDSSLALLQGVDKSKIAAVSFSGHMMGCLCVDKNGTPLRNSIIYCDQRSVKENEFVIKRIDPFKLYQITGHRPSPVYSLQKLMWIKENEPDIYRDTYKVLNVKDYIVFRLTNKLATDYTDAGGTEAFDINNLCWSEQIFDALGIDGEKFPDAKPSITVIGEVTSTAQCETGIPVGTPVVLGAGDGCAAGVGAGSFEEGQSYTSIGSSAWVATSTHKPIIDPQMRTTTFPHAVPDMYHPCGAMQAGGTSYQWAKEIFYGNSELLKANLSGNIYAHMDQTAAESSVGSNGVIFLPYLMGERSPRWDTNAKGAFLGLKITNTRGDLIRSVMEGVTFNLNAIMEIYREHIPISKMVFIGGGAKSLIWRKILADIYGMNVMKPTNIEECASMGAAIIGGVGVGLWKDFSDANKFITIETEERSNPEINKEYEKYKRIFEVSYHQLKSIFVQL